MSALIALGHIIGAIIALIILGIGILILAGWEIERNKKAALQEAILSLRIPIDDIENSEHLDRIVQFTAEKYSSELFRNRLSDLCGWIQTGWGWIGNLLQVFFLLWVVWYTVKDDTSYRVHAWWIVGISLFFWISSVVFSFACKLLTGRFPGQARQARKFLSEVVEKRHTTESALEGN